MVLTIIIAALTAVGLVLAVLIKPYITVGKIKLGLYWIIAVIGAILMLLTGRISFSSALEGITANSSVNPLKF